MQFKFYFIYLFTIIKSIPVIYCYFMLGFNGELASGIYNLFYLLTGSLFFFLMNLIEESFGKLVKKKKI